MRITFRPIFKVPIAILLAVGLIGPALVLAQDSQSTPEAVVIDTTAPGLSQPAELFVEATDSTGAVVLFEAPYASDDVDGDIGVDCAPSFGALFPIGQTLVTCSAQDAAGNSASVSFLVTVADQSPPNIEWPADIAVTTSDDTGAIGELNKLVAYDAVDGEVAVMCDVESGAFFPVGTTLVTCLAQDSSGLQALPVTFNITVDYLAETEEPTEAPSDGTPAPSETATTEPTVAASPEATETPTPEPSGEATETPSTEATETPTESGSPTAEQTVDPGASPTVEVITPEPVISAAEEAPESALPKSGGQRRVSAEVTEPKVAVPDALEMPWPIPPSILVTGSGPVDSLSLIWGNDWFPISQEFGHTDFSVSHYSWYSYGTDYGLDGFQHPGLDIGMGAGTALYSPVSGTVVVAGGVPYYTFYGNGEPGVGELMIQTDNGDQVILGHMGLITVQPGRYVNVGDFVGLSGGENGDHLHLEVREALAGGGYRIVDPRNSFLTGSILGGAIGDTAYDPSTSWADVPAPWQ